MKNKKSILLSFGTRPEAIKMAPLYHELKRNDQFFDTKICVTAQHREMLDQVLEVFEINPDIDLDLMKNNQDLFDISSAVLLKMREVLDEVKPDILLVHGDTTTTLFGAIAGFYSNLKVGHIEAGLRTFDIGSPYPEEFNRQITSKVSSIHFAPTKISKDNLLNENINKNDIHVTGNTVIDSLFWVLNRIDTNKDKMNSVKQNINKYLKFNWENKKFVLITGHRRENFGDGFLEICKALREVSNKFKKIHFVYPVHLNPNVQLPVNKYLSDIENIHLIDPLEYEPFVFLLKNSYFVLTDSGGIQEEAPSLGKPVLVMRDITERPEAVTAGTVKLVGANSENIVSGISELIENKNVYDSMSKAHNPFGDGKACERIVEILRK